MNKERPELLIAAWMWNNRLEKERLLDQLSEMKSKGFNVVAICPRFGLETGYLSNEWMGITRAVLEKARTEGMKVWIYDDLNWPSGRAANRVLAENPEFRAQHLVKKSDEFSIRPTSWKAAHGEGYCVDALNPEATCSFINHTHEQYRKYLGEFFGETLIGFVTDEPGLYNNTLGSDSNSVPWTPELPKMFQATKGYNIWEKLNDLWENTNKESWRTRFDYWDVVSLLYQRSYFRPLHDWCQSNGLLLTGHLLGEESLIETARSQGHFFRAMKYLDLPCCDVIRGLKDGSIIPLKLASSAAKLGSKKGAYCEAFGAFGWNLSEEAMKRVARQCFDSGTSGLILHGFYYSIRGNRHFDAPPSFFEEPHWSQLDNFSRVVHNLAQESEKNEGRAEIAVHYPMYSVWKELLPHDDSRAYETEYVFKDTSVSLARLDRDFDYLDDEGLGDSLLHYSTLILPNASVLSLSVLKSIKSFCEQGGKVIIINNAPLWATEVGEQEAFNVLRKNWSEEHSQQIKQIGVEVPKRPLVTQKIDIVRYLLWRGLPLSLSYTLAWGMRKLEGIKKPKKRATAELENKLRSVLN